MGALEVVLQVLMWFILAVLAIYLLVRAGAIAWFKTRREHAHRMMREMRGEDPQDG